ncbi:hypothetical protein DPMN_048508 [Dreissena polymorpha]|uniref:Dephospho-CoA kinase n=2 Tax=Dreissena polymorpha TaxID=45954 RepID=A0A9D4D9Q7_DREPO|nr:hypothetical protein DPMN_048508 [Dreissena polymorpha]
MMWKLLWLFLSGHQFVVMDLPLLFESKTYLPYMSYILVVSCSSKKQLERLKTRNNYTTEEAENRIKAQMPLAEKCLLATTVLDNNGTIEELQRQLHQICIDLRRSKRHWKLRLGLLSLFLAPLSILTYFLLSTN